MTRIRRIDAASGADASYIDALVTASRAAREEYLRFTLDLHDAGEDRVYLRDVVLPQNQVWVAEVGDQVAGFVAFANGWINHLYVAPEFQARGLGTRLLDVAKQASVALQLWVFQVNAPAIRFYERRGFRVVELTDGAGNEEKQPDARMAWPPGIDSATA